MLRDSILNELTESFQTARHKLAIVADCLSRAKDGLEMLSSSVYSDYVGHQVRKADTALEQARESFRNIVADLMFDGVLQVDCLPFII